jgi:hypothetical protein
MGAEEGGMQLLQHQQDIHEVDCVSGYLIIASKLVHPAKGWLLQAYC